MYQAGWSKAEIRLKPVGYAMHGFGTWQNRAWGQQSPLMARAVVVADGKCPLIFCCMDLGYITRAMRSGILSRLGAQLPGFDRERLVLTCTHTHSGPGGCTQDALYNIVTPGYVPEHVEAIINAACTAITAALADLQPVELQLERGHFDAGIDVAWNRSLKAYNRNPDVTTHPDTETHLAINREMQVLSLRRNGRTEALVSLFGVHATCCGNSLTKYSADNKGEAATQTEAALASQGVENPVAIFAQGTCGDVSPYYHGPGDRKRRAAIKGDLHYAYAHTNGKRQSERALAIDNDAGITLAGPLDGVFTYVDFSNIHVDPAFANGNQDAWTSEPCHGVAFFLGTPVDGPGMPGFLGTAAKGIARRLKAKRLAKLAAMNPEDRAYYERLYAAQGPKDILMEAGRREVLGYALDKLPLPGFVDPMVKEMKRQATVGAIRKSQMVPTVLPLQIVRIGQLALVCCPGEFTTTAGRRLVQAVSQALAGSGIEQVLITTYCNDYMGYVTTCEEYQEQAYEGGHTIFGQWTLAAFQTRFAELAPELARPPEVRGHDRTSFPTPAPVEELALRTNLAPPRR